MHQVTFPKVSQQFDLHIYYALFRIHQDIRAISPDSYGLFVVQFFISFLLLLFSTISASRTYVATIGINSHVCDCPFSAPIRVMALQYGEFPIYTRSDNKSWNALEIQYKTGARNSLHAPHKN